MKRTIVVLTVALLLVSAGAASLFAAGSQESAAANTGGLTIRIMAQNDYEVNKNSALVKWQEEYAAKKLGFPVKFTFFYVERNNERELLNLALIDGNIPDVFQGYPDPQFRDFIDQGVLRSFDLKRLAAVAPTYYGTITKYGGKDVWNFGKGPDGKQYGIPGLTGNGMMHYVPIIRDDWLKAVGINKLPETLDEFEKAFYAFTRQDPDGNGKNDTYGLAEKGMGAIFGAFGGLPPLVRNRINWTLIDGKINASITTDDMREALKLLAKWYKDGVIDPEWVTGENKGGYWARSVSFNNGIIGFSMPGMYYHIAGPEQGKGNTWCTYDPFHKSQGKDASYHWTKLPIGPKGKQGAPQWGVIEGWYAVYGRQVTDDQLEKWWQVCELLMTDTLFQDASIYGVPDVQWKYDENGVPQPIEGAPNAETDPEHYKNPGAGTNGIDRISGLAWDSEHTKRLYFSGPLWEFAKLTAGDGHGLPDLVWGDFPSKKTYFADVVSLTVEAYTDFINGGRDIHDDAQWKSFVKAVNDAGLTIMTKDAQEWYDTYHK